MENPDQEAANWSRVHLLAFRFAFVYLVLYNLPFPLGVLPHSGLLAREYELLWHKLVPWVGRHVLHLNHEIVISNKCSGDTTYDYVRVLCIFGFALAASTLWPVLDRSHSNYQRLRFHEWLRLYVRLSVGAAMVMYGAGKIFQVQFPQPNLYKLLQPFGDFTPMGLLWTFMGASRGYSVFTGWVQLFGGILLFVPRLTTLGALVGIAISSNIFLLNLFCNVPVKLYSLHLLLFCCFLVVPDTRRLVNFFLLNRSVEPAAEIGLFSHNRLSAVALVAQLTFGAFLVCSYIYRERHYEQQNFGVAARPPFYGIWMVDEFTLGGKVMPPLLTDGTRWYRVVFQFPKGVGIQSMNGAWTGYSLRREMTKSTFIMEKPDDPRKKLEFAFSSPDSQSLTLEGSDGENEISVRLHRADEKQFTLLSGGFHWINEDADLVTDEEGVCNHVRRADGTLLAR
jgi:uncharacterized membrane protein YphA (DoxX/SURF4 family)